jgi:hypothetical protein
MQAKLKRDDFTIRAVCGGGKMKDEARDRCFVAAAVETQQLLRLLLQMVKIGPRRQLLHGGSSCIGWPKVRNTASTKDGEISDAPLQMGSTLSADPEAACTASSDAMRWQVTASTRPRSYWGGYRPISIRMSYQFALLSREMTARTSSLTTWHISEDFCQKNDTPHRNSLHAQPLVRLYRKISSRRKRY